MARGTVGTAAQATSAATHKGLKRGGRLEK